VNTHSLYPISIKHNATYLPLKSDLRHGTAEEILKYKDANKHGRKKAAETASTGEASASGTTVEPEGRVGPSKECEGRRPRKESLLTTDTGGERDRGRTAESRGNMESRKDSGHHDARKAKETADEKDLADDEADRRDFAALQNKIEARRIAREIQTAHDTLASLRAEQDSVTTKISTTPWSCSNEDRVRAKALVKPPKEEKKLRAARIAKVSGVNEQDVPFAADVPRRGGKPVAASSKEDSGATNEAGTVAKIGAKVQQKRPADVNEPHRATPTEAATHVNRDESPTEILGPALVAGALGRRLGDARTAKMMSGIVECRVKIMSTRRQAKLPVPAPPGNSAESNSVTDCVGASDARLSLSALYMNVQLELPGEVPKGEKEAATCNATKEVSEAQTMSEVITVEPRPVSLTSVKKVRDEVGARLGAGRTQNIDNSGVRANAEQMIRRTEETPVAATITIETRACELEIANTETITGGKAEKQRKRVMRDIDVAMAMREHLATINPKLDTATSFIGSVCGRPTGRRDKPREIVSLEVVLPLIEVAMDVEVASITPGGKRITENLPIARAILGRYTKEKSIELEAEVGMWKATAIVGKST